MREKKNLPPETLADKEGTLNNAGAPVPIPTLGPPNESGSPTTTSATGAGSGVSVDTENRFSISGLRLPQNYVTNVRVEKRVTVVPVQRPPATSFFRVRPGDEWTFATQVFKRDGERDLYLVAQDLWPILSRDLKPMQFFVALTKEEGLYLWPIGMPDNEGRYNRWHESALQAVSAAKDRWIRVVPNRDKAVPGYTLIEPEDPIEEPAWPSLTLQQVVDIAFRNFRIDSYDHPAARQVRGKK